MKNVKYFALGLFIGGVIVGGVGAVKAYITKQRVLGQGTITSATVDLSLSPQSPLFNFESVTPGFNSGEQNILVKNTGTANLKYRMTAQPVNASDDNDLYGSLGYKLRVYDGSKNLKEVLSGSSLKDLSNLEVSEYVDAGEERTLGLELNLPSSLGSSIEGQTTNFKFLFEAVQSDGVFE